MKGLANLSPLQLASLAIGGSLAAGATFWLPVTPGSPFRSMWITLGVTLFAAGIFLAFKMPPELESGVANQRWPEKQIDTFRSILNSQPITILIWVFLAFYLSMLFFQPHSRLRYIASALYLPIITIGQLRVACKEPNPKGPFERLDWRSIPPLQSSHWGEK